MADEQKKLQPIVETPEIEEEVPFEGIQGRKPKKTGRTKEISDKDNRAFFLTCGCVGILSILVAIDIFIKRDSMEDSKIVESFVEIMKYIITTSMGFFFATTVKKD